MKIYRLFSTILAIIVMACLFGVQGQFQGQYVTPSNGYSTAAPSAALNPSQFSQFYTMTPGPAPSNPIGAPQQFEIAGNIPSTVYLGEQMQPVPYSQYRSSPAYTGANSLWIKGATAWTQYAVVPQGATVSLFAISPTGGSGSLTSDGQTYSNNYAFYPNSLLTFYASTIGQHTLSFAINGQTSNQVVIDVVGGAYTQPSSNPENYPGYYPDYYPSDYCGAGYYLEDGYCVPVQCSAGYYLDEDGYCVPVCNAGYHLENGYCVRDQVICNSSSHLENGYCVAGNVKCNASSDLENSTCVAGYVKCNSGYHLENGTCVAEKKVITAVNSIVANSSVNNTSSIAAVNSIVVNSSVNNTSNIAAVNSIVANSIVNNTSGMSREQHSCESRL